jgi:curved DNA-binding protein CbpA
MTTTNLYDVLGVARDATTEEIRRQYRRCALQLHPDRHAYSGAPSTSTFTQVAHAYDVLSDDLQRAAYDSDLAAAEQQQQPGRPSSSLFAGAFRDGAMAQAMVRQAAAEGDVVNAWDARFVFSRGGKIERRTVNRPPRPSSRATSSLPARYHAATTTTTSASAGHPSTEVEQQRPSVGPATGHHNAGAWTSALPQRQLLLRRQTLPQRVGTAGRAPLRPSTTDAAGFGAATRPPTALHSAPTPSSLPVGKKALAGARTMEVFFSSEQQRSRGAASSAAPLELPCVRGTSRAGRAGTSSVFDL